MKDYRTLGRAGMLSKFSLSSLDDQGAMAKMKKYLREERNEPDIDQIAIYWGPTTYAREFKRKASSSAKSTIMVQPHAVRRRHDTLLAIERQIRANPTGPLSNKVDIQRYWGSFYATEFTLTTESRVLYRHQELMSIVATPQEDGTSAMQT